MNHPLTQLHHRREPGAALSSSPLAVDHGRAPASFWKSHPHCGVPSRHPSILVCLFTSSARFFCKSARA